MSSPRSAPGADHGAAPVTGRDADSDGRGDPGVAGQDAVIRALARDPELEPSSAAIALRDGVLRRPGGGHIAGVCGALAVAGGLPPRLVRLVAAGLLALGIGLPLYLAAGLLIPRQRAEDGRGAPRVDIPIVSLVRLDPGRGDVVMALALIPSAIMAWDWVDAFVMREPAPLRLLIPVVGVGLVVLTWAALRARAIRRAYLFAQLGRRAGIVDDDELARTVASLRRQAPRVWAGTSTGDSAGAGGPQEVTPLGDRETAGLVGVLLAAGAAVIIVLSLLPAVSDTLRIASLPGGGRLAAAGAVDAAIAGTMLVVLGLRGRRSTVIALLGVIALALFAIGVVWVRIDASAPAGIAIAVIPSGNGPTISAAAIPVAGFDDVGPIMDPATEGALR